MCCVIYNIEDPNTGRLNHHFKCYFQERIDKFRLERDSASASTSASNAASTLNCHGDEDAANANQTLPPNAEAVSLRAPNAEAVSARVMNELECICCYDKMTVPVFQCSHGTYTQLDLQCRDPNTGHLNMDQSLATSLVTKLRRITRPLHAI